MDKLQIGDIVVGNNSWLNGMIGYGGCAGVIIHSGDHSSIIHLFTINEDITLMNEYIDKFKLIKEAQELNVGDLVELHPKIKPILTIKGVGTILGSTLIRTNDFDGKWKNDVINAYLVYFAEEDCEYTIPKSCLQLFSKSKND